ncbi:Dephospho-CoA kinase [Kiritimatiella glycovorans]|uniref:Dephospho-CoA kinase n=2 Tax=Kiritimatiella glycovorans TaxID=1307763 RepID=A0A0G3EH05_9BACT|nr:Dephospho-CoA kinase [Kiritimatiella glycovorans]
MTGGIACGKSEAGRMLKEGGWAVCEADRLAHESMKPGTAVHANILEEFGPACADEQGRIDRRVLGKRVFDDPVARQRLNEIVHPAVIAELGRWADEQRRSGRDAAAIVPLLFEAGVRAPWDAVLCIAASVETMKERLALRGVCGSDAEKRIGAQWPVEEKAERSDYVIRNDGDLAGLEKQLWATIERIKQEKSEP